LASDRFRSFGQQGRLGSLHFLWLGIGFLVVIPVAAADLSGVPIALLVPRSVRRAMHLTRTVPRVATPKVVKKARRGLHAVDNFVYGATTAVFAPVVR
jgi:hypothetical protein